MPGQVGKGGMGRDSAQFLLGPGCGSVVGQSWVSRGSSGSIAFVPEDVIIFCTRCRDIDRIAVTSVS